MTEHPAGIGPRAAAFGLDYLVIAVYIVGLTLIVQLALKLGLGVFTGRVFGNAWLSDLFAFLALILPVILYFAVSESSTKQATWGKRRLGLRVGTTSGTTVSLPRALLREGIKFLPWQIAHTSLFHIPGWPLAVQTVPSGSMIGFGIVWVLAAMYLLSLTFEKSHRTPYDWAAGTVVLKCETRK